MRPQTDASPSPRSTSRRSAPRVSGTEHSDGSHAPLTGPRPSSRMRKLRARKTFISRITVLYCTTCALVDALCALEPAAAVSACCLFQSSTSPARSCAMCTPPSRRITSTSPLCPPTGTGETSTDRTSCPRSVGRARELRVARRSLSYAGLCTANVLDFFFVCLFVSVCHQDLNQQ